MQITTGLLTACSGGNHVSLPVTIGGRTLTIQLTRRDFIKPEPLTDEEWHPLIVQLIRQELKIAGLDETATPVQIRNAISNKTFTVVR